MADKPDDPPRDPAAAPPRELRTDIEGGLRFLHAFVMQTRSATLESTATLYALLEELVQAGVVNLRGLDQRREQMMERELKRVQTQAHVIVDPTPDKYALKELPVIDCEALLPLCKSRCCQLQVRLSFQDLDERTLQWDYARPYQLRKRADGYCVHSDEQTRGCTVYAQRPVNCRLYDCRNDKRVWIDFDKRIPAPDEAIYAPPPAPPKR